MAIAVTEYPSRQASEIGFLSQTIGSLVDIVVDRGKKLIRNSKTPDNGYSNAKVVDDLFSGTAKLSATGMDSLVDSLLSTIADHIDTQEYCDRLLLDAAKLDLSGKHEVAYNIMNFVSQYGTDAQRVMALENAYGYAPNQLERAEVVKRGVALEVWSPESIALEQGKIRDEYEKIFTNASSASKAQVEKMYSALAGNVDIEECCEELLFEASVFDLHGNQPAAFQAMDFVTRFGTDAQKVMAFENAYTFASNEADRLEIVRRGVAYEVWSPESIPLEKMRK